jgi:hypothetical protein
LGRHYYKKPMTALIFEDRKRCLGKIPEFNFLVAGHIATLLK